MKETHKSEYLKRPDARGYLKVVECLRRWDPIGILDDPETPTDEYDSYAPKIVRMLDAGIDCAKLTNHLVRIVEKSIGIPCDRKRTRELVRELVEFWKEWKAVP